MKTTGERIREERERLQLNQEQFGKAGGVAKNTQARYEGDYRSPDAEYLQMLATLGVDILYIVTGFRNENTATTPIEMSYLRACRAFPNNDARMAGNAALMGMLYSYTTQTGDSVAKNNQMPYAAQNGESYGKKDQP